MWPQGLDTVLGAGTQQETKIIMSLSHRAYMLVTETEINSKKYKEAGSDNYYKEEAW